MKKRIPAIGCLLIAATTVAIGFAGNPAYADPQGNNGNHFGQIQNGNNGYHNGNQSIQLTQNGASVPEPASLALLGAGLAGIGIWRGVSRKA